MAWASSPTRAPHRPPIGGAGRGPSTTAVAARDRDQAGARPQQRGLARRRSAPGGGRSRRARRRGRRRPAPGTDRGARPPSGGGSRAPWRAPNGTGGAAGAPRWADIAAVTAATAPDHLRSRESVTSARALHPRPRRRRPRDDRGRASLILLFVVYQLWGTGLAPRRPRTSSATSSAARQEAVAQATTLPALDGDHHAGHRPPPTRTRPPRPSRRPPPPASVAPAKPGRAPRQHQHRQDRRRLPDGRGRRPGLPAGRPRPLPRHALPRSGRQRGARRPPHHLGGAVQPHRRARPRRHDHHRRPCRGCSPTRSSPRPAPPTATRSATGSSRPPRPRSSTSPPRPASNTLTLMACHPKYSAAQRIVVVAKLVGNPAPTTEKSAESKAGERLRRRRAARRIRGPGRRRPRRPIDTPSGGRCWPPPIWLVVYLIARRWSWRQVPKWLDLRRRRRRCSRCRCSSPSRASTSSCPPATDVERSASPRPGRRLGPDPSRPSRPP